MRLPSVLTLLIIFSALAVVASCYKIATTSKEFQRPTPIQYASPSGSVVSRVVNSGPFDGYMVEVNGRKFFVVQGTQSISLVELK
jgi:hypothetical protein